MAWGSSPTIGYSAKVIPLGFHVAVGQNVGWLNERAKNEKRERNCQWIKFLIDFFEEER
jgi:hypothetical protein